VGGGLIGSDGSLDHPEADLVAHARRVAGDADQRLVVVARRSVPELNRGVDPHPGEEVVGAGRQLELEEGGIRRPVEVNGHLAAVDVGVVGDSFGAVTRGVAGVVEDVGDEVVEAGGLLSHRVRLEVVGEKSRCTHTPAPGRPAGAARAPLAGAPTGRYAPTGAAAARPRAGRPAGTAAAATRGAGPAGGAAPAGGAGGAAGSGGAGAAGATRGDQGQRGQTKSKARGEDVRHGATLSVRRRSLKAARTSADDILRGCRDGEAVSAWS